MPVFNPTRRNRNIGTGASGHGHSNVFQVPTDPRQQRFSQTVSTFHVEQHAIYGIDRSFIVEEPRPGWFHPCSVMDVVHLLRAVPPEDLQGMNGFLFSQRTRKQQLLAPVWGCMHYLGSIGATDSPCLYEGPLIVLSAQREGAEIKWTKSLTPDLQIEFEQLTEDRHQVQDQGKFYRIKSTPDAARNTQLYRTLLHEIGHWVDHLQKVERPSQTEDSDYVALSDLYFSRPAREREAFAHRYAREQRAALTARNVTPFAKLP